MGCQQSSPEAVNSFYRKQASTFRKHVSSLERTLFVLHQRVEKGEARAIVQWAEEGEASTAYFHNLERKQGQQHLFSALRTLGGLVVTSFVLITSAWVTFYATLFTAQPLDVVQQDFFLGQIQQMLLDEQRRLCEGDLSLAECKLHWMVWHRARRLVWTASRLNFITVSGR